MKKLRKIFVFLVATLILCCCTTSAPADSSVDNYNDVLFPLTEYPAVPEIGGFEPSEIKSDFLNEDGSETCYAGSHQCDGFAKYAHDRFWHVDNWNRNSPSWEVNGVYTADVYTTKLEWRNKNYEDALADKTYVDRTNIVKDFFSSLGRGSFVRYGKVDDPTPANGVHSIVFDKLSDDGNGIWAYEANQDGECGVGYQMYTFSQIEKNYEYILYYVEHTLSTSYVCSDSSYHKVDCLNCDGYLRQPHSEGVTSIVNVGTVGHKLEYGCCSGYTTVPHYGAATYTAVSPENHRISYRCCTGYITAVHTFNTAGRCTGCGFRTGSQINSNDLLEKE